MHLAPRCVTLAAVRSATQDSSFFDRWSATYDAESLQALTYRPIHKVIIRWLSDTQPSAVLDLGCGTGQLLADLTTTFPDAHLVGLDLSSGMLTEAKARVAGAGVGLVLGDAQHLPFPPDTFDVVTCNESFHWYPDQNAALEQLATTMRPKGRLVIASIAATTRTGEAVVRRLSRASGQPIHAVSPRHLAARLNRAGFDVIRQRRVPRLGLVPWPVVTEARRR